MFYLHYTDEAGEAHCQGEFKSIREAWAWESANGIDGVVAMHRRQECDYVPAQSVEA